MDRYCGTSTESYRPSEREKCKVGHGRVLQHLRYGTGWGEKKNKRDGSSREQQGGDGSSRGERPDPDSGIAFARTFESSDLDILRERRGR